MTIGYRAKLARKAVGTTQKEAAKALGISVYRLARYESGKEQMTSAILIAFSRLYWRSVAYFVMGDDELEVFFN